MKIIKELGFETLPMLSEFVSKFQNGKVSYIGTIQTFVFDYTDFITQPFKLGQFIPCDKEGKPMTTNNHFPNREMADQYEREFQQAVDAVIFEGWVIVDSPYGENIIVLQNTPRRIRITNGKFAFKTIESFINNGGKLKLK